MLLSQKKITLARFACLCFITVKAITKLNLQHRDKFELEFERSVVIVHVLQTTQNLVISRCYFAKSYNAHAQLV